MSTKGYPAPLTWDRLLELSAQGHDHYDAALTSTRARQLVASVREHFSQPEAKRCTECEAPIGPGRHFCQPEDFHQTVRDALARELVAANAKIADLTGAWHRASDDRDAANAKIAELETQHDADIDAIARAVRHEDAANARADEAERKLALSETMVVELEALHDNCDQSMRDVEYNSYQLASRVKQLEYELAGFNAANAGLVCNQCTPEERQVLKVMAKARIFCPPDCYPYLENPYEPAIAELANRAAKAKK
jgi:hypothetical protein